MAISISLALKSILILILASGGFGQPQESFQLSKQDKSLLNMASNCDEAAIKTLLAAGADINAKDNSGRTALMYAAAYYPSLAQCGCSCATYNEAARALPTVQLLLNAHADINAKDNHGRTALMLAASTGNN